jgi:putative transposase
MKRKRFSVEQIVAVLKQAEAGMPVADLIRHVGISEQTFYRWKKVYVGLQTDQVRQLKQLQDENAQLKRLVAELTLDKVMLTDVLKKNGEAFPEARHCGLPAVNLCGRGAACVPPGGVVAIGVPVSQSP